MTPLINPLAINGKLGWCNAFRKHVAMSILPTNTNLVLIRDSIIANFDKCNDIFDKSFLSFRTLNLGIGGDKMSYAAYVIWLYHYQWNTLLFTVVLTAH